MGNSELVERIHNPETAWTQANQNTGEYKYENKRLKMENELLRDFLQCVERM